MTTGSQALMEVVAKAVRREVKRVYGTWVFPICQRVL